MFTKEICNYNKVLYNSYVILCFGKKKPQRRSKGVSARFGVHIAWAKIYTIYAQQGRKVTCFFTTIKPVHSATKCTIFLKVQNMTLRQKNSFSKKSGVFILLRSAPTNASTIMKYNSLVRVSQTSGGAVG